MPQLWSVLPLSVGTHMVRAGVRVVQEWYDSGMRVVRKWYEHKSTNESGAELGRRAAILSLLTFLPLRRVSLPAACVNVLVLLLLLFSFFSPVFFFFPCYLFILPLLRLLLLFFFTLFIFWGRRRLTLVEQHHL